MLANATCPSPTTRWRHHVARPFHLLLTSPSFALALPDSLHTTDSKSNLKKAVEELDNKAHKIKEARLH
jgi:hypothetical protein